MVDRNHDETRRGGREDAEARNAQASRDRESGLAGQTGENRNLSGSSTYETLPAQPAQGRDRNAEAEGERNRGVRADGSEDPELNPPRTTTGKMTAPKFGSAGSGGAELEPGPERD